MRRESITPSLHDRGGLVVIIEMQGGMREKQSLIGSGISLTATPSKDGVTACLVSLDPFVKEIRGRGWRLKVCEIERSPARAEPWFCSFTMHNGLKIYIAYLSLVWWCFFRLGRILTGHHRSLHQRPIFEHPFVTDPSLFNVETQSR